MINNYSTILYSKGKKKDLSVYSNYTGIVEEFIKKNNLNDNDYTLISGRIKKGNLHKFLV